MSSGQTGQFHSQSTHVSGGNFLNVEGSLNVRVGRPEDVMRILEPHLALSALHDSQDLNQEPPAECHPGTRTKLLARFCSQLDDPTPKNVVWFHGPAGAGKTAVMRTLCRQLNDERQPPQLLASFFFRDHDNERNSGRKFVATLAYQISNVIEEVRQPMLDAISAKRAWFGMELDGQVKHLITQPIRTLSTNERLLRLPPQAIVVDGLDECKLGHVRSQVIRALDILSELWPFPLIIIVSSRPHIDIRKHFERHPLSSRTRQEGIYPDDDDDADADIRKYLLDKFNEIAQTHYLRAYLPTVDGRWPSLDVVNVLVLRASGQFIFAATVIRFVESDDANPDHRLHIILEVIPPDGLEPFQQVDTLYRTIFNTVRPRLQQVIDVMAVCLLHPIMVSYDVSGLERYNAVDAVGFRIKRGIRYTTVIDQRLKRLPPTTTPESLDIDILRMEAEAAVLITSPNCPTSTPPTFEFNGPGPDVATSSVYNPPSPSTFEGPIADVANFTNWHFPGPLTFDGSGQWNAAFKNCNFQQSLVFKGSGGTVAFTSCNFVESLTLGGSGGTFESCNFQQSLVFKGPGGAATGSTFIGCNVVGAVVVGPGGTATFRGSNLQGTIVVMGGGVVACSASMVANIAVLRPMAKATFRAGRGPARAFVYPTASCIYQTPLGLEGSGLLLGGRVSYCQELLKDLVSLVEVDHSSVRSYHKTLADFLGSETRAGPDLLVTVERVNLVLAQAAFRLDFWHEAPFIQEVITWEWGPKLSSADLLQRIGTDTYRNFDYARCVDRYRNRTRNLKTIIPWLISAFRFVENIASDRTEDAHVSHRQAFEACLRVLTSVYTAHSELLPLLHLALFHVQTPSDHRARVGALLCSAIGSCQDLLFKEQSRGLGLITRSDTNKEGRNQHRDRREQKQGHQRRRHSESPSETPSPASPLAPTFSDTEDEDENNKGDDGLEENDDKGDDFNHEGKEDNDEATDGEAGDEEGSRFGAESRFKEESLADEVKGLGSEVEDAVEVEEDDRTQNDDEAQDDNPNGDDPSLDSEEDDSDGGEPAGLWRLVDLRQLLGDVPIESRFRGAGVEAERLARWTSTLEWFLEGALQSGEVKPIVAQVMVSEDSFDYALEESEPTEVIARTLRQFLETFTGHLTPENLDAVQSYLSRAPLLEVQAPREVDVLPLPGAYPPSPSDEFHTENRWGLGISTGAGVVDWMRDIFGQSQS